ncbi:hypothetical protein D3C80_994540 [compost metagenome]
MPAQWIVSIARHVGHDTCVIAIGSFQLDDQCLMDQHAQHGHQPWIRREPGLGTRAGGALDVVRQGGFHIGVDLALQKGDMHGQLESRQLVRHQQWLVLGEMLIEQYLVLLASIQ